MPKEKLTVTFSVTLTESLNGRLLSYCGKLNMDKTEAVRQALDKHLPIVIKREGENES